MVKREVRFNNLHFMGCKRQGRSILPTQLQPKLRLCLLISIDFPNVKQNLKAMAIKHLNISDHCKQQMQQKKIFS